MITECDFNLGTDGRLVIRVSGGALEEQVLGTRAHGEMGVYGAEWEHSHSLESMLKH
jgi:hypothetical protein